MGRIRWLIVVIVAIILMVFVIRGVQGIAFRHRYDETRLLGKTKDEVIADLGPPLAEQGDTLFYQEGMDPDAEIDFKDGRVSGVRWMRKP